MHTDGHMGPSCQPLSKSCSWSPAEPQLTVLSHTSCAAVEGSQRMAEAAQSIVEANQLSSSQGGPITVLSGRIEELQALPMEQVIPARAKPCREIPVYILPPGSIDLHTITQVHN